MKEMNNNPSSSSSYLLIFIVIVPLFVVSVIVSLFTYSDTAIISSSFHPPSSSSYSLQLTEETTQSQLSKPATSVQVNPNEVTGFYEVAEKKFLSKLEKLEAGLIRARANIREAARNGNQTSPVHADTDYVPNGDIYHNPQLFYRSYLEMEKTFKIFVYKEGEEPMFHDGPCKNIYSTEGRFINQLELEPKYRTDDPDEAHVYFLPFSIARIVQYLYVQDSHDANAIIRTAHDYVNMIAEKYRYWNRSLGADHVMLSCHDWGPLVSYKIPNLYNNSIRVLCNANSSERFVPSRDVSFPEINLSPDEIGVPVGGEPPSGRSVLAFFAGRLHGHIRPVLLDYWKENDPDLRVYEALPKGVSYKKMMSTSKYCLCPSGYEVASPRVVEAIYAECVPVLISISYVPPFSDVLNWNSFSVQVSVTDIPNLKRILMEIPQERYEAMQKRVKEVQKHFIVDGTPRRFDVYHMTLHSIWLRRLNIRIYD